MSGKDTSQVSGELQCQDNMPISLQETTDEDVRKHVEAISSNFTYFRSLKKSSATVVQNFSAVRNTENSYCSNSDADGCDDMDEACIETENISIVESGSDSSNSSGIIPTCTVDTRCEELKEMFKHSNVCQDDTSLIQVIKGSCSANKSIVHDKPDVCKGLEEVDLCFNDHKEINCLTEISTQSAKAMLPVTECFEKKICTIQDSIDTELDVSNGNNKTLNRHNIRGVHNKRLTKLGNVVRFGVVDPTSHSKDVIETQIGKSFKPINYANSNNGSASDLLSELVMSTIISSDNNENIVCCDNYKNSLNKISSSTNNTDGSAVHGQNNVIHSQSNIVKVNIGMLFNSKEKAQKTEKAKKLILKAKRKYWLDKVANKQIGSRMFTLSKIKTKLGKTLSQNNKNFIDDSNAKVKAVSTLTTDSCDGSLQTKTVDMPVKNASPCLRTFTQTFDINESDTNKNYFKNQRKGNVSNVLRNGSLSAVVTYGNLSSENKFTSSHIKKKFKPAVVRNVSSAEVHKRNSETSLTVFANKSLKSESTKETSKSAVPLVVHHPSVGLCTISSNQICHLNKLKVSGSPKFSVPKQLHHLQKSGSAGKIIVPNRYDKKALEIKCFRESSSSLGNASKNVNVLNLRIPMDSASKSVLQQRDSKIKASKEYTTLFVLEGKKSTKLFQTKLKQVGMKYAKQISKTESKSGSCIILEPRKPEISLLHSGLNTYKGFSSAGQIQGVSHVQDHALPCSQASVAPCSQASAVPYSQVSVVPCSQASAVVYSQTSAVPCSQAPAVSCSQTPAVSCSQAPAVSCSEAHAVPYSQTSAVPSSQAPAMSCSQAPAVSCSEVPAVPYSQASAVPCSQAAAVSCSQAPIVYCSEVSAVHCSQVLMVPCSKASAVPCSQAPAISCSQAPAVPCSQAPAVPCSQAPAVPCSETHAISCSQGHSVPCLQAPAESYLQAPAGSCSQETTIPHIAYCMQYTGACSQKIGPLSQETHVPQSQDIVPCSQETAVSCVQAPAMHSLQVSALPAAGLPVVSVPFYPTQTFTNRSWKVMPAVYSPGDSRAHSPVEPPGGVAEGTKLLLNSVVQKLAGPTSQCNGESQISKESAKHFSVNGSCVEDKTISLVPDYLLSMSWHKNVQRFKKKNIKMNRTRIFKPRKKTFNSESQTKIKQKNLVDNSKKYIQFESNSLNHSLVPQKNAVQQNSEKTSVLISDVSAVDVDPQQSCVPVKREQPRLTYPNPNELQICPEIELIQHITCASSANVNCRQSTKKQKTNTLGGGSTKMLSISSKCSEKIDLYESADDIDISTCDDDDSAKLLLQLRASKKPEKCHRINRNEEHTNKKLKMATLDEELNKIVMNLNFEVEKASRDALYDPIEHENKKSTAKFQDKKVDILDCVSSSHLLAPQLKLLRFIFMHDKYPPTNCLVKLAKMMGVQWKCIRDWFVGARQQYKKAGLSMGNKALEYCQYCGRAVVKGEASQVHLFDEGHVRSALEAYITGEKCKDEQNSIGEVPCFKEECEPQHMAAVAAVVTQVKNDDAILPSDNMTGFLSTPVEPKYDVDVASFVKKCDKPCPAVSILNGTNGVAVKKETNGKLCLDPVSPEGDNVCQCGMTAVTDDSKKGGDVNVKKQSCISCTQKNVASCSSAALVTNRRNPSAACKGSLVSKNTFTSTSLTNFHSNYINKTSLHTVDSCKISLDKEGNVSEMFSLPNRTKMGSTKSELVSDLNTANLKPFATRALNPKSSVIGYKCPHCFKVFANEWYLVRHSLEHQTFSCFHCPEKFPNEVVLRNHLVGHIMNDVSSDVVQGLACRVCRRAVCRCTQKNVLLPTSPLVKGAENLTRFIRPQVARRSKSTFVTKKCVGLNDHLQVTLQDYIDMNATPDQCSSSGRIASNERKVFTKPIVRSVKRNSRRTTTSTTSSNSQKREYGETNTNEENQVDNIDSFKDHSGKTCDLCGESFDNRSQLTEHMFLHRLKSRNRRTFKRNVEEDEEVKKNLCVEPNKKFDVAFGKSHDSVEKEAASVKILKVGPSVTPSSTSVSVMTKYWYRCFYCKKAMRQEKDLRRHLKFTCKESPQRYLRKLLLPGKTLVSIAKEGGGKLYDLIHPNTQKVLNCLVEGEREQSTANKIPLGKLVSKCKFCGMKFERVHEVRKHLQTTCHKISRKIRKRIQAGASLEDVDAVELCNENLFIKISSRATKESAGSVYTDSGLHSCTVDSDFEKGTANSMNSGGSGSCTPAVNNLHKQLCVNVKKIHSCRKYNTRSNGLQRESGVTSVETKSCKRDQVDESPSSNTYADLILRDEFVAKRSLDDLEHLVQGTQAVERPNKQCVNVKLKNEAQQKTIEESISKETHAGGKRRRGGSLMAATRVKRRIVQKSEVVSEETVVLESDSDKMNISQDTELTWRIVSVDSLAQMKVLDSPKSTEKSSRRQSLDCGSDESSRLYEKEEYIKDREKTTDSSATVQTLFSDIVDDCRVSEVPLVDNSALTNERGVEENVFNVNNETSLSPREKSGLPAEIQENSSEFDAQVSSCDAKDATGKCSVESTASQDDSGGVNHSSFVLEDIRAEEFVGINCEMELMEEALLECESGDGEDHDTSGSSVCIVEDSLW